MSNMRDVDHTHPHTNEPFGGAFRRGPDVAADGGRDEESRDAADGHETDEESMRDVDHESPTEGANRTFERGTEGRDDSV